MGVRRNLRRSNNISGLRNKLSETEEQVFRLEQTINIQKMYLEEMGKISTALKDIMMKELNISEEAVTKKLDEHMGIAEAEELDQLVEAAEEPVVEPTAVPNTTEENEIPTEPTIEEVVADMDSAVEDVSEVKEEKPKKKRTTKPKKAE